MFRSLGLGLGSALQSLASPLVSEKSLGFGFGKLGIGKQVSVWISVKIFVSSFSDGSVTLWELGTKKRSQRCKFTWFLRFCFLKMGDRNRSLGPGCRGGGVLVVVWESARREQSTASSFHSPLRTATGRDHPPTSENKHHNWKRSACQQGWILLDTVSTKFNLREKLKISNKWY